MNHCVFQSRPIVLLVEWHVLQWTTLSSQAVDNFIQYFEQPGPGDCCFSEVQCSILKNPTQRVLLVQNNYHHHIIVYFFIIFLYKIFNANNNFW